MLSYDHMNAYGDDSAGRELERRRNGRKTNNVRKSSIFDDLNCDVEFVISKCVEVDMCKNVLPQSKIY